MLNFMMLCLFLYQIVEDRVYRMYGLRFIIDLVEGIS